MAVKVSAIAQTIHVTAQVREILQLKMMNFAALQMMNCALNMMTCVVKMMDFALKMMDKVSTMTDVETVFGGGKAREKGGHIGPRGCKRTGGRTGMEDFVHSMRCILH